METLIRVRFAFFQSLLTTGLRQMRDMRTLIERRFDQQAELLMLVHDQARIKKGADILYAIHHVHWIMAKLRVLCVYLIC